MSAKNSKFSGIFAQARERETTDPEEKQGQTETPEAAKSVEESVQLAAQEPSKTRETAPKRSVATPETPNVSPPEPELTTAKTPSKVAAKATESDAATSRSGRPRGKRSDPEFTQITAYISKSTHQNVKIALLKEGKKREISELIEAQLVAWLAQNRS